MIKKYKPIGRVPDVFHYCCSCWQVIPAERERQYQEQNRKPLCAACAGEPDRKDVKQ